KNRANQNRYSNSPNDKNEDLTYKPETPHKPYDQKGGTIIPLKFHPNVVDSLKQDLEKIGYQSFNTQAIDLFIPSNREKVGVLFEVKTDIEKTSIYTAIGQLMYREACKGKPIKK